MNSVVTVMLQLRKVPANISHVEIASHVHHELNNLLNYFTAIANFDLCLLGTTLCSKGPLGREIVVYFASLFFELFFNRICLGRR